MSRFLPIACAFAVLAAAPVLAEAAPDATTPTVGAVPERKICRREDVTGSNIGETRCHTKAEWAALETRHDAEIRSLRDGGHWASNGH